MHFALQLFEIGERTHQKVRGALFNLKGEVN